MKKLIRKIIVWAVGFEPIESFQWTLFDDRDQYAKKLLKEMED